jgi:hypothetical protein
METAAGGGDCRGESCWFTTTARCTLCSWVQITTLSFISTRCVSPAHPHTHTPTLPTQPTLYPTHPPSLITSGSLFLHLFLLQEQFVAGLGGGRGWSCVPSPSRKSWGVVAHRENDRCRPVQPQQAVARSSAATLHFELRLNVHFVALCVRCESVAGL